MLYVLFYRGELIIEIEQLKFKIERGCGDGSVDKNAFHVSTKEQISVSQKP